MEVKGWVSGEILHGNAFVQHTQGAIQLDRMEQNPPPSGFLQVFRCFRYLFPHPLLSSWRHDLAFKSFQDIGSATECPAPLHWCHGVNGAERMSLAISLHWQGSQHSSQEHFSPLSPSCSGEYNSQNRSWIFSPSCQNYPRGPRPSLTQLTSVCHKMSWV